MSTIPETFVSCYSGKEAKKIVIAICTTGKALCYQVILLSRYLFTYITTHFSPTWFLSSCSLPKSILNCLLAWSLLFSDSIGLLMIRPSSLIFFRNSFKICSVVIYYSPSNSSHKIDTHSHFSCTTLWGACCLCTLFLSPCFVSHFA